MAKKKRKNTADQFYEVRIVNPGNRKVKVPRRGNPSLTEGQEDLMMFVMNTPELRPDRKEIYKTLKKASANGQLASAKHLLFEHVEHAARMYKQEHGGRAFTLKDRQAVAMQMLEDFKDQLEHGEIKDNPRGRKERGVDDDLFLYAVNTGSLYPEQQKIERKLLTDSKADPYKLFLPHVKKAAKLYANEIDSSIDFSAVIDAVVDMFIDRFNTRMATGELNYLLEKNPKRSKPGVLVAEKHSTNKSWYVRDEKSGEIVGSAKGHKTEAAANKEIEKILTTGSSRYLNPHRLTPRDMEWVNFVLQGVAEANDSENYEITEELGEQLDAYKKKLSMALEEWTNLYPPKYERSLGEILRADAAYNVFMTLNGEGVGIWDGRWDKFYSEGDLRSLQSFLKKKLGSFADDTGGGTMNEAFQNAVLVDNPRRAKRGKRRVATKRSRNPGAPIDTTLRQAASRLARGEHQ